jgi:ABC-type lipoprotein export system ATPase subunit
MVPEDGWLIQAKALRKTYRQGRLSIEALRGVDLYIPRGDFVVILGPSGGGKSTLLHLLGGIDRPTAGSVRVNGIDLETSSESQLTRFRRDNVGFIFQSYNLLPALDALNNTLLPLLAKGWSWKVARQRGEILLEQVGLTHRRSHRPAELSGGEQQRVAIARALAAEPALVLADEPTGDLDSSTAEGIVQLMLDINQRLGVTFVVATHNPRLADSASDAYDMRDGLINQRPNRIEDVPTSPLSHR